MIRPDCNHIVLIETLTEQMCRDAGISLAFAGKRAVIERGRSGYAKVCLLDGEQTPGTTLEAAAMSIAHTYGAQYVA